ncbi:hypothetical protein H4R24_005520 [Coemansia sp. RSA 988]|nr:hypothetical protein H4R24_005520 [Coemansia sp. RSA 988]
MIYEEDGSTLSWDPEAHEPIDPMYTFYEFLSTIPLYAKKELFWTMDKIVGNNNLQDVFCTSCQMRWAMAILRFGMQLPLEDIDIIEKAFNYYKNIIFTQHRLEFKDTAKLDKKKKDMQTSFAALEVLTRPGILFNPRAFFKRELPTQADASPQKNSASTPPLCPSTPPPSTNSDKENKPGAKPSLNTAIPTSNIDKHHLSSAQAVHFTHTSSQMLAAQDLWDKYIPFLANVLQIYSTTFRLIQPRMTYDVEVPILRNIIRVIDMILSQGGTNPILKSWCNRYRPIIGPELWDKTWMTIGDRLESSAIKLLMDVWGWIITRHKVSEGILITNVRYWLHRDKVVKAWLFLVSQLTQRVMRANYPYDKSVGINNVRVHFANYAMTITMSDDEARYLLAVFAGTVIDFNIISAKAYYMYATEVCEIIESASRIRKIISVNGAQYAQNPPTANHTLYYFGNALFAMALRRFIPTKEYILAKQRVIAIFTYLLTLEENPNDRILESNRTRMLYAIHSAITKDREVQSILPNMPDLLKNSIFIRPFIPNLFDLVCRVLPDTRNVSIILNKRDLRHSAYDTLSGLVAFFGYYYTLGRLDLIANSDKWLNKNFEAHSNEVVESITSTHQRAVLETLISNESIEILQTPSEIKQCKLSNLACKDKIFSRQLQFIFQLLLLSVAMEKCTVNMRYATCITLTFLHQYVQYCPDYVELFVKFLIDQLRITTSEEIAITYIYGITQAASITWADVLTKAHFRQITTAVIDALSDCDANLHFHNRWHHYHQRFISSLRCLISWVLVLENSSYMEKVSASKLVSLLVRCNNYIDKATYSLQSSDVNRRRRLHLTTSCVEEYSVNDVTDKLHDQPTESSYISSLTMLHIFGNSTSDKDPALKKDKGKDKDGAKVFVLSKSLYKSLYTAISVYSSIILRCMDNMKYDTHATTDIHTTRKAINRCSLPENEFILRNFDTAVVHGLEGYIPTSVSFFAQFFRAIYTVIVFRRFEDGKWSDGFEYITSRYANSTKQWLSFPTLPKGMDPKSAADLDIKPLLSTAEENRNKDKVDSLPWVRVGDNLMYPDAVRKDPRLSTEHDHVEWFDSPVDAEGNEAIGDVIATNYKILHKSRKTPEFLFTPATPPKGQQRGNTYNRLTCTMFFGIDFSMLDINEQILKDLNQLDDMDRSFSAYAGVIYLQSEKSLSTKRNVCKGPLLGVSTEFNHFLKTLDRSQTAPPEEMSRNSGDMPLLRYVFTTGGSKVCYNLAPNVSSLISGKKMSSRDNQYFYELLRKRGIAVMWFDSYAGILDKNLAWEFIDQLQNCSDDPGQQPKVCDDEYLHTQTSSARQPDISDTAGSTYGTSIDPTWSQDIPRASPLAESFRSAARSTPPFLTKGSKRSDTFPRRKPYKPKKSGFLNRAIRRLHLNVSQDVDEPLPRSESEPAMILNTKSKPKSPGNTPHHSATHSVGSGTSKGSRATRASSGHTSLDGMPKYNNVKRASDKGKQPETVLGEPKSAPTEPLMAALPSNPDDNCAKASYTSSVPNDITEPTMRIMIALSPVADTKGRLVKIAVSATGGSEKLNEDFENMTGPLMTRMVVETKNVTNILSATVLDASANMASLQGKDFSMVYRRMEMIKDIIRKYGIKYESTDDAHKSMFPVGQSGVESTLHIPHDISHPDSTESNVSSKL